MLFKYLKTRNNIRNPYEFLEILNDFLQIFENAANFQEAFQSVRGVRQTDAKMLDSFLAGFRPSARSLENVQNFWYNEYRK